MADHQGALHPVYSIQGISLSRFNRGQVDEGMKLKEQVTNLELSKTLKELGVKQESLFYWWYNGQSFYIGKRNESWSGLDNMPSPLKFEKLKKDEIYSAFTVSELGKKLPPHFNSYRGDFGKWFCYSDSNVIKAETQEADTEANARGKMLQYLIENNISQPPPEE